jgi:hypothetical protein
MGQIQKTVWTCDGTCGTTVENDGQLPEGWVTVTFTAEAMSATSGRQDSSTTKTFHALGPCLFDWGAAQMEQLAGEGVDVGTNNPTPPPA